MQGMADSPAAITAMEHAVELVGNNGLTRKYPLQRHYRDVLCAPVHAPQDDSFLAAAGRAALAAVTAMGP
jgi:alkylation response protein AidB-like acyl-CoA dehydrogenase